MITRKEPIQILYFEDNEDDIELMQMVLAKSNLECTIQSVTEKEAFLSLELSDFDILISDYNLNNYDGLSVIRYVRSKYPSLPIIILSGTVGEELAVDLLHAGANDFVLKSNLKKLPISIQRSLQARTLIDEKRRFQQELVEKNLILDTIFDSFSEMVFLKDTEGKYLKINRAFCNFFKLHEGEVIGRKEIDVFPAEIAGKAREQDEYVRLSGQPLDYELEIDVDGSRRILEITKTPIISDNEVTGIVGECRDVTTQKILLEETIKAKSVLSQAERLTRSGSFEYDADLDLISFSPNFKHILRLQVEGDTISFRKFASQAKEEDRDLLTEGIQHAIENYEEYKGEHRFLVTKNGKKETNYFKIVIRPDYKDNKSTRFYGTMVDVTAEHESQRYMVKKQEEDRKELARELHDNLGQKMNGISMYLSKISDDLPDHKDLIKVKQLVHEAIDDLSFLISNISVKQIEEHSLEYAVDRLLNHLPENISVDKHYEVDEKKLSPYVKTQVYRIVQEAINNTMKYSEATKVKLDILQGGGVLSLKIEDNGVGFEKEKVLGGNGLQNITQRVKQTNGLVNIDSKPGKGVKWDIKMPVS